MPARRRSARPQSNKARQELQLPTGRMSDCKGVERGSEYPGRRRASWTAPCRQLHRPQQCRHHRRAAVLPRAGCARLVAVQARRLAHPRRLDRGTVTEGRSRRHPLGIARARRPRLSGAREDPERARPVDHHPDHLRTSRHRPGAENPTRGSADIGDSGALSSTDTPRTETNRTPRVAKTPLGPAVVELAAACRQAGLTATFVYLKPDAAAAIEALVATHGVPALVAAAKSVHRPGNPMRLAHGWLPLWRSLSTPRVLHPKCGDCDEYGWLPDDEQGRAVRCGCRAPAAA